MVKLMSRCLVFAEGVVTMLCPVFLALALRKEKLRLNDPLGLIILAGATLTAGVLPLLACLISKSFPDGCERWACATRLVAAPVSCIFLIVLAFFISISGCTSTACILTDLAILILFESLIVIRILVWWLASEKDNIDSGKKKLPIDSAEEKRVAAAEEFRSKIDKSHEFLSGITGILFLGLEGLAGLVYTYNGLENALRGPMLTGLIFCGFGVFLMSVHMIPVLKNEKMTQIVYFTDSTVVAGTGIMLMIITTKLAGNKGWLFLLPPVSIFVSPVCEWVRDMEVVDAAPAQGEGECKAAPLGLTKFMLTGFFSVAVMRATGSDLPVLLTDWFLIAAAAAVACGVLWRRLSHLQAWKTANSAPFCTHLCVLAAAILLAVMACRYRQDVVIQCPP